METSSRRSAALATAPAAAPPFFLLMMLTCTALSQIAHVSADLDRHIVGGRGHWAPNINYTVWAAGERFYVSDWLVFYYEKGYYDVMQVNATDYDHCSAEHPIKNDSKGNSYVFQLNNTGPYYFICSHGQCWSGMKLAINVEPLPAPAPTPAPSPPSSSIAGSLVGSAGRSALWAAVVACGAVAWTAVTLVPGL